MNIRLEKWDRSLAVRLPGEVVDRLGWRQGECLDLTATDEGCVIIRSVRPKYSLEQLVGEITPDNCHCETEWGCCARDKEE